MEFEMKFQNRMWNEIFKYITQMKFEYNIWILKGSLNIWILKGDWILEIQIEVQIEFE